jgi:hypothetical protein
VDGFADFEWIFLQLRLHSLGFLDEVSKFLQLLFKLQAINVYGEIAICCKESCLIETLREEHTCFFLSQGYICLKLVNCSR